MIKVKLKVHFQNKERNMIKRRYLITFRFNTKNENKYAVIHGDNKDIAYGQACALYGFMNVGGVYVDNEENRAYLFTKGYTAL